MTTPAGKVQYLSIIEDTQASLTAALAKIEALKLRQKQLVLENIQLRKNLVKKENQENETEEKQEQKLEGVEEEGVVGNGEVILEEKKEEGAKEEQEENKGPRVAQFKVKLNNGKEESPGYVRFAENKMELLEVKAEVTPEQFVSMCYIPPKTKHSEVGSDDDQSRGGLGRFSISPLLCIQPSVTDSQKEGKKKAEKEEEDTAPHTIAEWSNYLARNSVTPLDGINNAQQTKQAPNGNAHSRNQSIENDNYSCQIVWTRKDEAKLADILSRPSQHVQNNIVPKDGAILTFDFKTPEETREHISECIQAWSSGAQDGKWYQPQHVAPSSTADSFVHLYGTSNESEKQSPSVAQIDWDSMPQADIVHAPPKHMQPAKLHPTILHKSDIMTQLNFACLANQLPSRHRQSEWELLYSTRLHGISLQTLYRKVSNCKPLVTVIHEQGGNVFGCYTSDTWKVQPRYYGTGETFVFQLLPHMIAYNWDQSCSVSNEYFQYGQQESLGIGGGPHFALWVDGELMNGNSGTCRTFGSPCLASSDDFKIKAMEVWHLA